MPSINRTYQEIAAFDQEARQWLANREAQWKQQEGNKDKAFPGTKFTWAVNRVLKRSQAVISDYQERVTELHIKHAAVDDKGVLDLDPRGQFRFKPDELILKNQEQSKLFRSETQIEPYYATEVPDDLTESEKDLFADFVIKPETTAEPA